MARVLLVDRYFWPDTNTNAVLLRAISARWAAEGHEVVVLTAQPGYNRQGQVGKRPRQEHLDGFRIRRVRLLPESKKNMLARSLNLLLFMLATLRHLMFGARYQVVLAGTTPPVFLAWAVRIGARFRGSSLLYHNQDIHPEAAIAGGMMRPGLITRWMSYLDRRTTARCTRVIVLSEDMVATHRQRGLNPARLRIINNCQLPSFQNERQQAPTETEESQAAIWQEEGKGSFRILFVGNLGRFQALEVLLAAAHRLRDRGDIRFEFVGEGVMRPALERQAGDLLGKTVFFRGYHPHATAMEALESADVAVVSLAPEVILSAYPSKVMTYLQVGLPLLLLMEPESELARMVADHELGEVCGEWTGEALASAVLRLEARFRSAEEPARQALVARARSLGDERFSLDRTLDCWSQLLAEVLAEQSPRQDSSASPLSTRGAT